jgi:hypothetical protein
MSTQNHPRYHRSICSTLELTTLWAYYLYISICCPFRSKVAEREMIIRCCLYGSQLLRSSKSYTIGLIEKSRSKHATTSAYGMCLSTASPQSDKLSRKEKAVATGKKGVSIVKKYGAIFVGTYLGVYVTTLTGIFMSLEFDIFNAATFGLDPKYAVHKFCDYIEWGTGYTGVPEYIRANPMAGTFALAWVMTKFSEPLRFAVAVGMTPRVSKFLGYRSNKKAVKEATKIKKTDDDAELEVRNEKAKNV